MNARVALVIVSHSDLLARGVVEVAQQMAPHVWCEPAGGTDEGRLGTSMARIERAVAVANTARRSAEGGGVLIMSDLGSATMNVDAFVELHDHPDDLIHVAHAPLVEGSVAAAVAAQQGRSLHEVARAAQDAAHCPQQQESHPQSLAHDEREAGEDPPASSTDRARLSAVEGASEETPHPGTAGGQRNSGGKQCSGGRLVSARASAGGRPRRTARPPRGTPCPRPRPLRGTRDGQRSRRLVSPRSHVAGNFARRHREYYRQWLPGGRRSGSCRHPP